MKGAQPIVFLWMLGTAFAASAQESWPEFRGPDGQGHAGNCFVPLHWSEEENVLWKTKMPGEGWSSPLVLAGEVWLTQCHAEGTSLGVVRVDLETGKILTEAVVFRPNPPVPKNPKNSFASPTPVLVKDRVFVHFGAMGTACLDRKTAQVLWSNDTLKVDHKEGPGSSLIPVGNLLIVHCDGIDEQYVVALDQATGKVIWKTRRTGPLDPNTDFRKAYSTPLAINDNGRTVVISPGADGVMAYDVQTGAEVWKVRYKGFSNVPRPVTGAGLLFVCTGYMRPQLWAIRPGGSGDVTQTHVEWKFTEQVPANASPIVVDDTIYMAGERGVLTALDVQTGQVRWKQRIGGEYTASPIAAAGRIYFTNEQGKTTVIRPGKSLEVLATNVLKGRFLASPAVARNSILLRSQTHLYRLGDRSRASSIPKGDGTLEDAGAVRLSESRGIDRAGRAVAQ